MSYDPSANLTTRALREAYRTPPADDLPDPRDVVTDAVDSSGMVTRVRMLGWEEILAVIERDCRGTVE